MHYRLTYQLLVDNINTPFGLNSLTLHVCIQAVSRECYLQVLFLKDSTTLSMRHSFSLEECLSRTYSILIIQCG